MSMAFTIQVSHGSNKLQLEISGPTFTVDDLKELLFEETEVPPDSQKIIFKGKTLQEGRALVEYGIKQGSKLLFLGRKFDPEQEIFVKRVDDILKDVDEVEKKMREIEVEIEGIEKGFLQDTLIPEACRGLDKRTVTCSELLMQKVEKLDALAIPASNTMVRRKRKSAVIRTQALLERADQLSKRISKCRDPPPSESD